jgi:AAA+ ATPase superfamily predicted ATPase
MLQAGGPAMVKDFFDREEEIKEAMGSLEKDNILLISPKRYGKTSLMSEEAVPQLPNNQ